jgi:chemotaxis protein CheX
MAQAEIVKPFVESIQELFDTMLGVEVSIGEVRGPEEGNEATDIIGVIGMSGTAKGIVAMKLPLQTALNLVGKMVGAKFEEVDSSIVDGVGEFVNILAGLAKKKYVEHKLSLSLPTVVRGGLFILNEKSRGILWFEIPVTCDLGQFRLAVGLSPSFESKKEQVHEGVGS